jgi:hypothetical protein
VLDKNNLKCESATEITLNKIKNADETDWAHLHDTMNDF